jgi:hypothetical protein
MSPREPIICQRFPLADCARAIRVGNSHEELQCSYRSLKTAVVGWRRTAREVLPMRFYRPRRILNNAKIKHRRLFFDPKQCCD